MITKLETGNIFSNYEYYIVIGEIRSSGIITYSFSKNLPTGIPDKPLNPMTNKDALISHLNLFKYSFVGNTATGGLKEETLFNIDDL